MAVLGTGRRMQPVFVWVFIVTCNAPIGLLL